MDTTDFFVGGLYEFVAECHNNDVCDNECADPGTGSDDCHCEDF